MKTPVALLLTALSLAVSAPVMAADSSSLCEAQARDMERELGWRRDQMSTEDRMRAHQRLSAASTRCHQDADSASQDLRSLQRDLIQQSRMPPSTPPGGTPPAGMD